MQLTILNVTHRPLTVLCILARILKGVHTFSSTEESSNSFAWLVHSAMHKPTMPQIVGHKGTTMLNVYSINARWILSHHDTHAFTYNLSL